MTRDDVLAHLREAGAEILGVDAAAITEDARFKDDLEADSLDLVEVVMALEERLDMTIPEEALEDVTTVGNAIDVVLDRLAART